MITKLLRLFCCILLSAAPALFADGAPPAKVSPALQRVQVTVGETTREALVYAPAAANEKPAPLVFVFHGHGGGMRQAALSMPLHTHWPEALVVYPQGLPTVGQITDPKGERAGWQPRAGANEDRDLKFFDVLLTKLNADYKVDRQRLYATGHSNGGGFTYLLWAERGARFAAFAPSSAVMVQVRNLTPKPAMHVAGQTDDLVKFAWQERMMKFIRRKNGCEVSGTPWGKFTLRYASKGGTPLVTYIHPGGHEFARDALPLMVKFFKEFALPGTP